VCLGGSSKSQGFLDLFTKYFAELPSEDLKQNKHFPTVLVLFAVLESLGFVRFSVLVSPATVSEHDFHYQVTHRSCTLHGTCHAITHASVIGTVGFETPVGTVLVGAMIGIHGDQGRGHAVAGIYCNKKATTYDANNGQLPLTRDWKTSDTIEYARDLWECVEGTGLLTFAGLEARVTILCIFVPITFAETVKRRKHSAIPFPIPVAPVYIPDIHDVIREAVTYGAMHGANMMFDMKAMSILTQRHAETPESPSYVGNRLY
jgi:hypothetical protein